MSWLSVFLRREAVRWFIALGIKMLKRIIGNVAEDLQNLAWKEVQLAEASGKTGLEKYEEVFKKMRYAFPKIRESIINHAIETAVLELQESKV